MADSRNIHAEALNETGQRRPLDMWKRELKKLVDIYDLADNDGNIASGSISLPRTVERSFQGHLSPQPKPSIRHAAALEKETGASEIVTAELDVAGTMKLRKLLLDKTTDSKVIYDTYMQLQYPRAARLPYSLLQDITYRLAVRERKQRDPEAMSRYLSVIDEMKETGVPLSPPMWNSTMHCAVHDLDWITASDVESVMSIWKEMEEDAHIKTNHATLTTLYTTATKGGKYGLADSIWREFETRNLKIDRVARVARIYAQGLQRNGDEVRSSYNQLVEAGEIVDTSVLNCVISSLILADEGPAAEVVFGRMKTMQSLNGRPSPNDWRGERELRQLLLKTYQFRGNPEAKQVLQELVPIGPDRHTYRILIKYHAVRLGNIDRAMDLVSEVIDVGLPVEKAMFDLLFRGFMKHGGVSYSSWTQSRLEGTWDAFRRMASDKTCDWEMDSALAEVIVAAFAKCVSKERALEIWETVIETWKPTSQTLDAVNKILSSAGGLA
jgi:hypothetical protein